MKQLHREWVECALAYWHDCFALAEEQGVAVALSLHHIDNKPRHDVRPNLIMLCGHGTAGAHGQIEANDPDACAALRAHLRQHRPDTMRWLAERHGAREGAAEWLLRRLPGGAVQTLR